MPDIPSDDGLRPVCILDVDSPSYPPSDDERQQCGCKQCLAALRVSPSPNPQGWQPIGTAPKDGTDVLLTDGHYRRVGYWTREIEAWSIDVTGRVEMPTHWMVVPSLPAMRNPQQ